MSQRPGKGLIVGGRVGGKEVVDFHEHIGRWVSQESDESLPTTIGIIHYSKDAMAHIIPAHPQILTTKGSEEKTEDSVRAIANAVMLGSISPNIREIYIEDTKEVKQIDLYVYFDRMPTDDEIEEVNVIESEMMSSFTIEYSFEYQILYLPYPDKSYSRGMCVYKRYEPNPVPELVSKRSLVVAANKAMLGRIHPNIEAIWIVCSDDEVTVLAYFNTTPSNNQIDDMGAMVSAMRGHFSENMLWRKQITLVTPSTQIPEDAFCVYHRYSPIPKEQ